MAITIEMYEKMCAYFDGELSLEEEKKFLELVEKDPELKKEFEWEEKMIFDSVPQYKEEPVIASDTGIPAFSLPEEVISIKRSISLRPVYKLAIAATIIISVGILIFVLSERKPGKVIGNFPRTNDSLNLDNYLVKDTTSLRIQHDLLVAAKKEKMKKINKLGRHEPDVIVEPPQLGLIQEAFVEENYSKTIDLSKEAIVVRGGGEEENIKAYALFYRAIANLELNNDSAAIFLLKKVCEKENLLPGLIQEAQWNLSKAYYKSGNKEDAKKILQQLLNANGFSFAKEGKKLMEMINNDND